MISSNGVFIPLVDSELKIEKLTKIQFVLKLISTCNLRCTYCYWFFKGDNTWEKSSVSLEASTVDALITFSLSAIQSMNVREIDIIFHGGEPMMIKKKCLLTPAKSLDRLWVINVH